jgi:hypothetical protein
VLKEVTLDLICHVLGLPFDPLMKGFFGPLINYDSCFTFGEMSPFSTSPFFVISLMNIHYSSHQKHFYSLTIYEWKAPIVPKNIH